MLGWLRALMPKEDRFFNLFEQHAALVVAAAESLRAALDGGSALHQHLQAVVDRVCPASAPVRQIEGFARTEGHCWRIGLAVGAPAF